MPQIADLIAYNPEGQIVLIAEIKSIQAEARTNGVGERPRWPMIIMRTPKGWTRTSCVANYTTSDRRFPGNHRSEEQARLYPLSAWPIQIWRDRLLKQGNHPSVSNDSTHRHQHRFPNQCLETRSPSGWRHIPLDAHLVADSEQPQRVVWI